MGFGRKTRSFSDMNEVRRKRGIRARKVREARVERQKAQTANAIARMQSTANIFGIKATASFDAVDQIIRAAQQRVIDNAIAKSERTKSDATAAKSGGSVDITA
uniref:30S ribosomal protein S20 n=1 Tax=OCS116 cluster bacterium TaxID=2030921 RepID=A0A2A4ZA59_9PROT